MILPKKHDNYSMGIVYNKKQHFLYNFKILLDKILPMCYIVFIDCYLFITPFYLFLQIVLAVLRWPGSLFLKSPTFFRIFSSNIKKFYTKSNFTSI